MIDEKIMDDHGFTEYNRSDGWLELIDPNLSLESVLRKSAAHTIWAIGSNKTGLVNTENNIKEIIGYYDDDAWLLGIWHDDYPNNLVYPIPPKMEHTEEQIKLLKAELNKQLHDYVSVYEDFGYEFQYDIRDSFFDNIDHDLIEPESMAEILDLGVVEMINRIYSRLNVVYLKYLVNNEISKTIAEYFGK
jgi:hypothetical protein